MYPCSFTSEKSAGECQTKIPRDHTLKKEVWAGFKQIEQVLILESKVVQVVQKMIDQRGAIHHVQTCFVKRAKTRVYAEVGEVHEGVKNEILQELVVVATTF